jgi:hypothetical protein
VALEKQRLLRQAQRRALELQTASEIARDTASTLSLDLLLNRIVICFLSASISTLPRSSCWMTAATLPSSAKRRARPGKK